MMHLNICSCPVVHDYIVATFQRILKHSRFGRVSVKCYYDAPEQRLTVEILHAADLIALDANGEPDLYITTNQMFTCTVQCSSSGKLQNRTVS